MQEMTFGQLRNMDQAFQAFFNAGKSPKINHIRYGSGDNLIHVIPLVYRFPGIRLQAFETQGNSTFILIGLHDINADFLPAFKNITRMPNTPPA